MEAVMGEARRKRLAAQKHLKLVQGGKPEEVLQPPPRLVDLHILVLKPLAEKLDAAHAYARNRFASRNDFLVACLEAALVDFAEALRVAIAAREKAEAQGTIRVVETDPESGAQYAQSEDAARVEGSLPGTMGATPPASKEEPTDG
jgi:hypothetical protein